MKIIYCPTMYSNVEEDVRNTKNANPVSGHKFQENLFLGLIANQVNITTINIPRIRSYPYNKKIFINNDFFYVNKYKAGKSVGAINLVGISYITKFINLYKEIRRCLTDKNETYVLMTFNSYIPQTLVFNLIKKLNPKYKIVRCDVIGDLHSGYGINNSTPGLKGKLINWIGDLQDKSINKFELFVFLTEPMADIINVPKKRYTILEAMYTADSHSAIECFEENEKKIVFYAGSICREYGIEHLLKSFSLIKDPSYRLIIAGGGDNPDLINSYCKKDSRITYLGMITPKEVKENHNKATVLISPRLPDDTFVKYSFPSKTLECLASGKPYIAHKLPCEPPEYNDFIQYADGNSDEDLKNVIIRVCEKSVVERREIGEKARRFVITQKNPEVMCSRIVSLIKNNIDDRLSSN